MVKEDFNREIARLRKNFNLHEPGQLDEHIIAYREHLRQNALEREHQAKEWAKAYQKLNENDLEEKLAHPAAFNKIPNFFTDGEMCHIAYEFGSTQHTRTGKNPDFTGTIKFRQAFFPDKKGVDFAAPDNDTQALEKLVKEGKRNTYVYLQGGVEAVDHIVIEGTDHLTKNEYHVELIYVGERLAVKRFHRIRNGIKTETKDTSEILKQILGQFTPSDENESYLQRLLEPISAEPEIVQRDEEESVEPLIKKEITKTTPLPSTFIFSDEIIKEYIKHNDLSTIRELDDHYSDHGIAGIQIHPKMQKIMQRYNQKQAYKMNSGPNAGHIVTKHGIRIPINPAGQGQNSGIVPKKALDRYNIDKDIANKYKDILKDIKDTQKKK